MTLQDDGQFGKSENPITFQQAAESFLACEKLTAKDATFASKKWLLGIVVPILGGKALSSITPGDIEGILNAVAQSGKLETVKRVRLVISQVFRFANSEVPGGFQDPTVEVKESFPAPIPAGSPAITDQAIFGQFLKAIDVYKGSPSTRLCLKLSVLLVLRPGEMRDLKWDQVDLDHETITLQAPKGRGIHVVPLSRQAVKALEEAKGISEGSSLVSTGRFGQEKLSAMAILAAIRSMGFPRDQVSPFGIRKSFTHFMEEEGWSRDLIDEELSAGYTLTVPDTLPRRSELMQAWAGLCDEMKARAED